jgi:EamA domain-containing membrane protein RarD
MVTTKIDPRELLIFGLICALCGVVFQVFHDSYGWAAICLGVGFSGSAICIPRKYWKQLELRGDDATKKD